MNNSMPLVSIGVASYNNAKYVVETLDSIYNQSYSNIELIIVDDCSKDNSVEVIEKWLQGKKGRFTSVKFLRNAVNKGVCFVCNKIVENSAGKYVSLASSDDTMLELKIEKQVEILENAGDEVGMVYSDTYLMKEDGSPRYGYMIQLNHNYVDIPQGNVFEELMQRNFIPAMSTLIKLSVLKKVGKYDETLKFEDWDMWLRISKEYQILFSDYPSVRYRINTAGLGSTIIYIEQNVALFKKHIDESLMAKNHLIESIKTLYKLRKFRFILKEYRDLKKYSGTIKLFYLLSAFKIPPTIGNLFYTAAK